MKWSEIRGEGRGRVVYIISSVLKGVGLEWIFVHWVAWEGKNRPFFLRTGKGG